MKQKLLPCNQVNLCIDSPIFPDQPHDYSLPFCPMPQSTRIPLAILTFPVLWLFPHSPLPKVIGKLSRALKQSDSRRD